MSNPELTGKPSRFDRKARALIRAAAPTHPHRSATRSLARGLGWFSVGLGLVQLIAPRALGRLVGLPGRETLIRAHGLREIAAGVVLMTARQPATMRAGILTRLAGDALDLSALGLAAADGGRGGHPVAAIVAAAGVTVLDVACASALRAEAHAARQTIDYSHRSGLGPRPSTGPAPSAAADAAVAETGGALP